MPVSEMQAPALSTQQDDSAFSYAKVNKVEVKRTHLQMTEGEDYVEKIRQYYSLEELFVFLSQEVRNEDGILQKKFRRVAFQFPDDLICDSATVVQELQKMQMDSENKLSDTRSLSKNSSSEIVGSIPKTDAGCGKCSGCTGVKCGTSKHAAAKDGEGQRFWILADTSYSACCIDEVAAQHVNADLVVHFGDACLNPIASLPAAYVFGKPKIDLSILTEQFKSRFPLESYKDKGIVIMADAPHTHLLDSLASQLTEYKIVVSQLPFPRNNVTFIGEKPSAYNKSDLQSIGRVFKGIRFDGADDEDSDDAHDAESELAQYELFYIGSPQAPRLLQLTTKFESVTTFHNNLMSNGPFPNLMRRYRYMHMARAAGTIGILVNTLSLANTKVLINQVAKQIKDAGKKHYIFVVGKPNVAKLANFEAVDLWCVLGCDHQGIILDQTNEFYKPLVTPYELLLAIGDEFTWTGKWVTDFKKVLSEMAQGETHQDDEGHEDSESGARSDSDEEPEFNPVTGQYVSSARPLRRIRHLQVTSGEDEDDLLTSGGHSDGGRHESTSLVNRLSSHIALRNTVSTSAAHLQTRHWTGLGSDWVAEETDEDGATLEEGTSGIARGYNFDVTNGRA